MFTGKKSKENGYNVAWLEARFRGEEAVWALRKGGSCMPRILSLIPEPMGNIRERSHMTRFATRGAAEQMC